MWIQHGALALVLLFASGPGSGLASGSSASTTQPVAGEDFATLLSEYERALEAHEAELRRLDGAEWREAVRKGPALVFWPRFQALADAGEGRALFWMAANARARGASILDGRDQMRRLYAELVERHGAEDWFGAVVEQLPRERSQLGGEEVVRLCRVVLARNPAREVQALSLETLAGELRKQQAPEARKEAAELMERLANEYADTEVGARAANRLRLEVGAVAPDFTGKTIEGYEFKLSDYRGKVVLLDFYGFW